MGRIKEEEKNCCILYIFHCQESVVSHSDKGEISEVPFASEISYCNRENMSVYYYVSVVWEELDLCAVR